MFLLILSYVSLLAFIGLSIYKAIQYGKMPMHGRLDLYPVPKEKGKGHYGGSYYEVLEWWKKPRETSLFEEIVDMLKEVLFIKKLFDNQRPLWWISYSLHLGIYILFVWTALLFVGALTELAGITMGSGHWWAVVVYHLTFITGLVGALMVAFGAGALLIKRQFVDYFKKYTTLQEYFNLAFILVVAVTGLMVWVSDPGFNYGRHIAMSMLTFSPIEASAVLSLHIILLGILLIYIPLTKMSHYVGKYFSFHKVLWDNDPNVPGSEVDKIIKEAQIAKPKNNWSAPHYQPEPPKTQEM
ncbi:MAG: nitrate reductase gamma subunit [Clostridiaceae bacterium BRH_c20a]|nr:MAG: nitrate reductase gamma subunit [Clostridiaceae bacterium BRH_c20a]